MPSPRTKAPADPSASTPTHAAGSPPSPTHRERLHRWLETAHRRYHRRALLSSDPIQLLYRFDDPADREVVGLIAACLAYGNVRAILGGIENTLSRMAPSPRACIEQADASAMHRAFRGFRYRVTGPGDMAGLLTGAGALIRQHGSLQASFRNHLEHADETLMPALGRWVDELCEAAGSSLYHLLPHPDRGSACKRLNLYLRWMVRRDAIDPGGWGRVRRARLVVPLDTHMHRVAVELGLTRRKQPNLRTAIEVTEALRAIRPDDPLRYDFALTRPGILRLNTAPGPEGRR